MSYPLSSFWLCFSGKNRRLQKSDPSRAAASTPIKVKSVQFKPLPLENRQDSTHFRFQVSMYVPLLNTGEILSVYVQWCQSKD